MTYWPISSPSVFAATKHTKPEQTQLSHDGTERAEPDEHQGTSDDGSQAPTEDGTSTQGDDELNENDGTPPRQPHTSEPLAEDDVHGEIIAVKATRSGHMFATLTKSTFTIWQTKVMPRPRPFRSRLTFTTADCHPGLRIAIAAIPKDVRPQHRHSPSPRLSDTGRTDYAGVLDHILDCDRPFVQRLQNSIHKYTRESLEEK
jgi:hypothetical protein